MIHRPCQEDPAVICAWAVNWDIDPPLKNLAMCCRSHLLEAETAVHKNPMSNQANTHIQGYIDWIELDLTENSIDDSDLVCGSAH